MRLWRQQASEAYGGAHHLAASSPAHHPRPPPTTLCSASLFFARFCCILHAYVFSVSNVLEECCKCSHRCCKSRSRCCDLAYILHACCIFSERFDCFMQHEIDVAAGFFPHNQQMTNNLFNIFFDVANGVCICCRCLFSMLQILLFDVAMLQWSVQCEVFRRTSKR